MLRIAAFLCLFVALARALTDEEIGEFGTTGQPEQNTGFTGWVSVTSANGNNLRIRSNSIPDHDTGDFPAPRTNPNHIQEQNFNFLIAKDPVRRAQSTCLPMGPIAIAVNGVVMYNPWDVEGQNAVEGPGAEVFDHCDGHPDPSGTYHYHKEPSSCLFDVIPGQPSDIIGVAFDGFAIYGPVDENGNTLTSADLDECHGRLNSDGVYQYHTTSDYPYLLGCYRGTPQNVNTDMPNCRKADDAITNGGEIDGGEPDGGEPDGGETDGGASGTSSEKRCRNPNSRRCKKRQRRSLAAAVPANARVPKNLFKRKLPHNYQEFLSNIIFGKK